MSPIHALHQRRRLVVSVLVAGIVGAVAVAIASLSVADTTTTIDPPARGAGSGIRAVAQPVSFAYLSKQHSNSCSLPAAELMVLPSKMRLQGSCCQQMDAASYLSQLDGLGQYSSIPQIPPNPYDVPASLAQQLIRYHATIHLSLTQHSSYNRAMQLSPEQGPCCCHCWRWAAFQGLSDYLIAERGWTPEPLGHLIGLLDGCGGSKPAVGTGTTSTMRGM